MEYETSTEDPDELFRSMYDDISEEQWEFYREQAKFGNYVLDDSDDDSVASDRSVSPSLDDEYVTNVELIEQDEGGIEEDDKCGDQVSWGCDAADKYAQGKISFTELNDIMEVKSRGRGRPRKKIKIEEEEKVEITSVEETESKPIKKKRKARRKNNVLPKELEGLMGAANLSYAKGNTEDAIKMCMELIRLAPNANEPFQTLAVIYDELGESRKAFQCYLVAAFLNPSDTEEWIRLAEISLEQNELQQAISCFSRAIRNEPTNVNFLWERCNLYEQVGERKRALAGYELIIKNLSNPEDGEKCVDMAREIAKVHHDNSDDANAVKVLDTAFIKFPSLITSEDVNFLLELQISQKMYRAAVKTFVQHCGVTIQILEKEIDSYEELSELKDEDFKLLTNVFVPEVLPIDLVVKFLVSLIHLRAFVAMQPLLTSILQEKPDDIGDLHLDIAEALIEVKEYEEGKNALLILLASSSYYLPAVWMKYADCLHALNNVEEAIQAYLKVVEMAPTYQEARLALSSIYLGMGKKEEALKILHQDIEDSRGGAVIGIDALYRRCKLLESEEKWEEYYKCATLLQYSHCMFVDTEEELAIVVSNQTCKRRIETLREHKAQNNKIDPEFIGQNIPFEEMWDMFKGICKRLADQHKYLELQNLSLAALTSALFMKNPQYARELEFQALISCFYSENYQNTYILIRDLVIKNINKNAAWNLFVLLVTKSQENRHSRFCIRLMMKNQDHLALGFLNGHSAMISGTYKHALGEYMCILKEHPNNPFALFFVGATFIHMACQKFATKRHFLTIQGFSFLIKYLKLKGECQETLYNIGRAFHQLGLKDGAVHYYKKALIAPPVISGKDSHIFDLRREIAYNLALIYQASGAMDLVYLYTRKYIVV